MTYKIFINKWISEIGFGKVSDDIVNFFREECDVDADTYLEQLENEDVDSKFKVADNSFEIFGAADIDHYYGSVYGGLGALTVFDENNEEVYSTDEEDNFNDINVEKDVVSIDVKNKQYFYAEAEEKGYFECEIDIDEPFDINKLTLLVTEVSWDDETQEREIITGFKYGDEEYELEDSSTNSKAFWFNIIANGDSDED
jgi:hypothetical protein